MAAKFQHPLQKGRLVKIKKGACHPLLNTGKHCIIWGLSQQQDTYIVLSVCKATRKLCAYQVRFNQVANAANKIMPTQLHKEYKRTKAQFEQLFAV